MSEPTHDPDLPALKAELDRLRLEQRAQGAVLERELTRLKAENVRLLERAQFVEELSGRVRAQNEQLEILASLTRELASFDLDGVLELCVERIPFLVGARCASVYLYDRPRDRLVLKHHTHGRSIDTEVDLRDAPSSLMARVVRTRQVLCIDDLDRFFGRESDPVARPHHERYETRSCLVVPLVAAGEVQGVLNLTDRFDHTAFHPDQLDVVRRACELVAVSLRNARLFDEVQRAARTDGLTGVLNRQALLETLELEIKRARRYQNALAIVLVKLDGLRLVNLNHGLSGGDGVLKQAATLLRTNVRDVDLVGRSGGASFCVILPEQERAGALTVAGRLARIMAEARYDVGTVTVSGAADTVTATLVEGAGATRLELPTFLGVAVYAREGGAAELLQRALGGQDLARERGERVGIMEG